MNSVKLWKRYAEPYSLMLKDENKKQFQSIMRINNKTT